MEPRTHNAVAAAFSDRELARVTYDELAREGFPQRWMAVTKPADDVSTTSENDIAAASDGTLGASGRFFSGEGNSLRRSLEDHGIMTDDAIAIDEELGVDGAVIVVAAHDRPELAASLLARGGGHIYGTALPQPSATSADEGA